MMRCGAAALVGLVLAGIGQPSFAKNDIRGVATTQALSDVLEALELDGAQCELPTANAPTVCSYDERTHMTVYAAASPPNRVEKLTYTFHFKDLAKMREKLQALYGLKNDHIEGEHKLFTGERLNVELNPDGFGSLTITNEALVRRDAAAAKR